MPAYVRVVLCTYDRHPRRLVLLYRVARRTESVLHKHSPGERGWISAGDHLLSFLFALCGWSLTDRLVILFPPRIFLSS
jgi:hypothetical protein